MVIILALALLLLLLCARAAALEAQAPGSAPGARVARRERKGGETYDLHKEFARLA